MNIINPTINNNYRKIRKIKIWNIMCISHPAQIIKIENGQALVRDFRNIELNVIIATIPEAKPKDWILINANLAIKKINHQEAEEIIKILTNE